MGLSNKEQVYCQTCYEAITDGGYVSDIGSAYHANRRWCIPNDTKQDNSVAFRTREELQQDIKNGKLIHYGKLELTLSK